VPRQWYPLPPMEAAVVYRFHTALRGVGPKLWRQVELPAGSSSAEPTDLGQF
jgi:hypothetical protein